MKSLSLFILLCFTTQVFAADPKTSALEALIDDYQYFATVDWDQKDKELMAHKTDAFGQDLMKIMGNKGISREQLVEVITNKMPEVAPVLKARLTTLPKNLSHEDLMQVVSEMKGDLYKKGASWNGEIDWQAVGFIAGTILVIGLAAWYGYSQRLKPEELGMESDGNGGYKYKEYVCTGYGNKWECSYTDSNYGSTTISSSSCGWVYQCTSGYFK